jgi:hypothetical protein
MRFKLFGERNVQRRQMPSKARVRTAAPSLCFRPKVEALEDRLVLSTMMPAAPVLGPAQFAGHSNRHEVLSPVHMLPLSINNVTAQAGQLVANGSLGSTAFQLPLTLTATPNAADPTCPILNLQIPQGIHLSLLGLNVDTSGICLSVTAMSGSGNLLGNLLCDVANALNPGGGGLGNLLSGLSTTNLNMLLGGINNLLNSALADATTVQLGSGLGATPSVTGPNVNILHLSLGPVNLNLLGLNVALDNCAGGPVTVDITATPGAGNLLGNLLADLSGLLDGNANLKAIEHSLDRVANDIRQLVKHTPAPVHMLPLSINNVTAQAGQLVANGSLGSTAFQLPLTLTATPNAADPTCPILNLQIPQGIHLSLLGLNVDTSGICLSVTAQSGPGNLLGNLLCDVANALNPGGVGLGNLLSSLSTTNLNTLLGGISSLLNSALADATTVQLGSGLGATPSVTGPNVNILHLSLGPVNLNLLGLNVALDNCAGGPVTVDITATPGAGNLLGNLLADLSNLLNSNASLRAIEHSLERIALVTDILSLI